MFASLATSIKTRKKTLNESVVEHCLQQHNLGRSCGKLASMKAQIAIPKIESRNHLGLPQLARALGMGLRSVSSLDMRRVQCAGCFSQPFVLSCLWVLGLMELSGANAVGNLVLSRHRGSVLTRPLDHLVHRWLDIWPRDQGLMSSCMTITWTRDKCSKALSA